MIDNTSLSNKIDQLKVRSFGWIKENLLELDNILEANHYEFYLKAVAELLLLCALYRRKQGFLDVPISNFLSHVTSLLNKIDYVDHLARNPSFFHRYALMYVSLRDCGLELEELRTAIQDLINRKYVLFTELKSFQMMDISYTLDRGHFDHTLPQPEKIFKNSLIHNIQNTVYLQLDDIYSLTHIIFYLTDFGFKKIGNLPHKDVSKLFWLISSRLGLYTIERDLDVLAELLMCCQFLRFYPYPTYIWAWTVLIEAQNADGSIVGSSYNDKGYYSEFLNTDENSFYFKSNYHSTFVTAMLSFLSKPEVSITTNPEPRNRISYYNVFDAIRRADVWITDLYKKDSSNLLTQQLYFLLEKWIYCKIFRDTVKDTRNMAVSISETISNTLDQNKEEILDNDIALTFLSVGILRKLKVNNGNLETFLQATYNAVKNYSSASSEESILLFPVRYLFNSLGLKCDLSIQPESLINNHPPSFDQNVVKRISNAIAFYTEYGTVKPDYPNTDYKWLIESSLRMYCL